MDLSNPFNQHKSGTFNCEVTGLHIFCRLIYICYMSNRWQKSKINKSFSSWPALLQGLPQGSVLWQILFNIYLNNLFYFLGCDKIL